MHEPLVTSLQVLAGICLWAGAHHAIVAASTDRRAVHFLFTALCVITATYSVFSVEVNKAATAEEFLPALRGQIVLGHLFGAFFIWFVALYTGVRPLSFLIPATLAHGLFPALAFSYPLTFVYEEIVSITPRTLPWGEQIFQVEGSTTYLPLLEGLVGLVGIGFALYACWRMRDGGRRHSAILLASSALVLLLTTLHDGLWQDLPVRAPFGLGEYGVLTLIVVMSVDLARTLGDRTRSLQGTNVALEREIAERSRMELEKARVQEQLHRAQELNAVGHLASGVAHELNNLLMVISAHVDLVKARVASDPEVSHSIESMEIAVSQAKGVSRDLLDLSRKARNARERVDLRDVTGRTARMLNRLLPAKITLDVHAGGDPVPVMADAGQLQQVVVNLVLNARDAMPEGGRIDVRAEASVEDAERSIALLVVSDTGEGMPPGLAERVTAPFFTTKHAGHGTGLGLSIVKSIVDLHAGTLEIDSREGRGTTVRIRLPLAKPDAAGRE